MGAIEDEKVYGLTIRESANDGSDFSNPAADYRRLFLGEDGQLHVRDSAGVVTDIGGAGGGVDDGTSFPGSPATGDLFHRTDLSPALWRYDGTRWLSAQRYRTETPVAAASSGNATIGYLPMWQSEYGVWLIDFRGITHVATTNNGTNFWTVNLKKWSDGSNIVTFATSADSANVDVIKDTAIGAVSTENALYITVAKTLSPGNIYPLMGVTYNLIAT